MSDTERSPKRLPRSSDEATRVDNHEIQHRVNELRKLGLTEAIGRKCDHDVDVENGRVYAGCRGVIGWG